MTRFPISLAAASSRVKKRNLMRVRKATAKRAKARLRLEQDMRRARIEAQFVSGEDRLGRQFGLQAVNKAVPYEGQIDLQNQIFQGTWV